MNLNPSQWLDIGVIAVAFIAAVSGWRSGALGSLMSFVGVILGAVAGIMLAPHVVANIEGSRTKLFASLLLILVLVVIGEVAGVVLGRAMRGAIRNRVLRTGDSVVGVVCRWPRSWWPRGCSPSRCRAPINRISLRQRVNRRC
ncbi:Possible membrane-associated serine protease [Mycobacteroides abscessus]|nr:Possible membrane-associated serine protease [Mycobacteroides abscessus]